MDYLKVFLVLAPQLIAGCLIYLLILKRDEVALVELLSIGGVFGIVTSTIFDQIFVNLQLPRIGWLVPLPIALVVFRVMQKSETIVLPKIQTAQAFRKTFLPIVAISAMALGTEWFWLFPSGVLFVIASVVSIATPQKYSRFAIRTASLGAVVVGIFMIANRPKIWWFMYEFDFPFLQSLSRSLADWGLGDYVLLSGTNTRYHWFTYAWVGLVDRSSDASVFLVLTRVAPVVFVLLITGITWTLISQHSISKLRTFLSSLIVMTASTYPLWGYGPKITLLASPSQFYATAILFTAIFLLLQTPQKSLRFEPIVLAVLSASTMLSKTMHGVILVCAIAFALSGQIVVRSKVSKTTVVSGLSSIAIALTTYFVLIENSEGKAAFEIRFGDFFWQLQGDARLLSEKYVDLFGILTVIAFAILPGVLILANFLQTKFAELKFIHLLSIGSLVAGIVLAAVILGASGENLYFLQAAIALSTLLGLTSLSNTNLPQITNRTWIYLVVAGVALCLLSYLIPSINSGAPYAIKIRSMRVYTPALILVTVALFTLTINLFRRKQSFNQVFKLVSVTAVMGLSFAAANWADTIQRKHSEFSRDGETYLATADLENLANWINSETGEVDIVASNFGWPKLASGDIEFFRAPCTAFRNKEVSVETCRRTTSSLLTSYMHRRTWLQTTFLHYTGFTPEMDSRQTATLGFASDPTAAQAQQMLDDGVDWFVVDRSTTDRTSWEPFATVRYSNDTFFVLELNKI